MLNDLQQRQKQFRAAGMVCFTAAAGLLLSRILSSLISPYITDDSLADFIFTMLMQGVFLVVIPYLIYKLYLGKSFKQIMVFSNYRKIEWTAVLMSFLMGIFVFMITIGVSAIWQVILMLLGYNSGSSSGEAVPFEWWRMLLAFFLTAIMPAVCEEFTNRGGVMTVMRGSLSEGKTVLIGGIIFGLFHQYIDQVFYTFVFGMFVVYIDLKARSIYPGMIVHFTNNALSVYFDYAADYGFLGSDFFNKLTYYAVNNFSLVFAGFVFIGVVFSVLVIYYVKLLEANRKKVKVLGEGTFPEVTVTDAEAAEEVKEELPLSGKVRYKPVARDLAFYIAAAVIAVLTTVYTFFLGFGF